LMEVRSFPADLQAEMMIMTCSTVNIAISGATGQ
jgi:hypothetical protein